MSLRNKVCAGIQHPVTAHGTANPTVSEWQVPLVFPLPAPQLLGISCGQSRSGGCQSQGAPEKSWKVVIESGAACKWQHTDTPVMMFPVCHPLPCTETKQMAHFPKKLDFSFFHKDRIGNKRIAKAGWTPSVCGWRVWTGGILWLKSSCHKYSCRINGNKVISRNGSEGVQRF